MTDVICHACNKSRAVGDEPCPHCGAGAYPHRRTAEEHADYLRAVAERDRIGAALHELESRQS